MFFDFLEMKRYIEEQGIKQKAISTKSGISEVSLSLILQGKRKCEAGEYANLCNVLDVDPSKFMKQRVTK